jgi:ABC-type multidrug transport system fused ATPase/permease subunit
MVRPPLPLVTPKPALGRGALGGGSATSVLSLLTILFVFGNNPDDGTASLPCDAFLLAPPIHNPPTSSARLFVPTTSSTSTVVTTRITSSLFGKKRKGNTPGPGYANGKRGGGGGGGGQPQQERASVKEARFDAATRQFMFTLVGLTKTLPDKSKDILKNIHLSFYPGAKIGVVGLNGSGKVRVFLFLFDPRWSLSPRLGLAYSFSFFRHIPASR